MFGVDFLIKTLFLFYEDPKTQAFFSLLRQFWSFSLTDDSTQGGGWLDFLNFSDFEVNYKAIYI